LFALAGHKASTTALSWREDSKILASGSEDGTIKWWESQEGRQVKTWNAHDGGVLTLAFSRDGKIVSGGRDKRVSLWDANGNKLRSIDGKAMVVQVAFTQDGTNIVAADFSGDVAIWDSKGTEVARLDANPPPLAMRLEALQKQILALESAHQTADSLTNGLALPQHQAQRKAEKHFASARERQTESEEAVKTLKEIAAGKEPPADIAEQLAAAREARAKARTAATKAGEVFQAAQKDFKTAHDKARGEAGQAREGLVKAKAQMARVQEALLFTPVYHARQRVVERKRKLEALAAVATAEEEESNRNSGAATDDQVSDVRAAAAKAAAQALADEEEKLKKLTAEYERGRRLGSTDAFNQ
jgi:hypothetical protein